MRLVEVDDAAALGHALAAHCDAIAGPDHSEQRRDEAGEIVSLAGRVGDRPLELLGRRLRAVASAGDGRRRRLRCRGRPASPTLAGELRQPMYGWYVPLWQGMRALMLAASSTKQRRPPTPPGRSADARESVNAFALTFTQWWVSERMQGRFVPAAAEMRAVLGFDPGGQPIVVRRRRHRLRAVIAAQLDDRAAAHAHLDVLLAAGLRRRPKDSEWLPEMAQLAEVAAFGWSRRGRLRDATSLLTPYAHRFCVEGIGAAFTGSVHWYLALLARGERRRTDAARPTSRQRAKRIGGSASSAIRRRSRPNIAAAASRRAAVDAPAVASASLVDEGATWADHLRRCHPAPARQQGAARPGGAARPPTAGGALPRARRRHRCRRRRRTGARRTRPVARTSSGSGTSKKTSTTPAAANDPARAERAEDELDALVEQLSQAFGLSGRARARGSAAERARTTVTSRVRAAIRQAAVGPSRPRPPPPALGAHRHLVPLRTRAPV